MAKSTGPDDHYAALGVAREADDVVIRTAYRAVEEIPSRHLGTNAGVIDRTPDGDKIGFPHDAVHVDFTVKAA